MNSSGQEKCTLPPELLAIGVFLAGEPAWLAEDAVQVIRWLAERGCAVVGVELWQEDNGFPKWISSSDYNYDAGRNWGEYCQRCEDAATSFVMSAKQAPASLFNLSWMSQQELSSG